MTDNDKPRRLFYFLLGLSQLSREHGVIVTGLPDLEHVDRPEGAYALNPNNDGPVFAWRETPQDCYGLDDANKSGI